MGKKEEIASELSKSYSEGFELHKVLGESEENYSVFSFKYQIWYTKAIQIVKVLAPDRFSEFTSFYEINPKRKDLGYGNYVIRDYLMGVGPNNFRYPDFDNKKQTLINFGNQLNILRSLISRIDSVLSNIDVHLLSDLLDAELVTARNLIKTNLRAAGALAGVIIENHLQKVLLEHGIDTKKKNPTISEMIDPLKNKDIIDTPTWRKITYLADIRNICCHKKENEPTKDQVIELIDGANWLIKNVF